MKNQIQLYGHLTEDPTGIKFTNSSLVEFSLAVNERFKDSQGNLQEKVTYFKCKVWGGSGKPIMDHLGKGSAIMVRGSMDNNQVEGKTYWFVTVQEYLML